MIIDVFSHVIPSDFVSALKQSDVNSEVLHDLRVMLGSSHLHDVERRIRILEENGIDKQVVSFGQPLMWQAIKRREDLDRLTRIANDGVYEFVEEQPEHFIGAATLPILDDCLDEFDRCTKDLGMKAIQIYSNVQGKPLDNDEFRPFFRKANDAGIPLLLHPQRGPSYPWINEYSLLGMFQWPFDTSLAMARLVFGKILEDYPNLKLIVHHHGAMVPLFPGRLVSFYDGRKFWPRSNFKTLSRSPVEYFKMFYADTVSVGYIEPLMLAYRFFGVDHLLFGTDYPFGPENGLRFLKTTLNAVRKLPVPEEERARILGENARGLLRL
jgi:aminocarboxymuconate-semialdehyde decarboxylase